MSCTASGNARAVFVDTKGDDLIIAPATLVYAQGESGGEFVPGVSNEFVVADQAYSHFVSWADANYFNIYAYLERFVLMPGTHHELKGGTVGVSAEWRNGADGSYADIHGIVWGGQEIPVPVGDAEVRHRLKGATLVLNERLEDGTRNALRLILPGKKGEIVVGQVSASMVCP